MPFTIVRQDITKMKVDAIVNAANTELATGGGVCGAIFNAAGGAELKNACAKLAPIQTGDAVITPGFKLPAKYVIHTAGPVYCGGKFGEAEQLRLCYLNSLKIAVANKCESIAFPLISGGIYGYPKDEALSVATLAIKDFLADHDIDVYLAVFDKTAFEISEKLLGDIASYIDENYVDEHTTRRSEPIFPRRDYSAEPYIRLSFGKKELRETMAEPAITESKGIDDIVKKLDESFGVYLMRLIDAKGKTDVEIYKRANIDRKLFSKIRTVNGYMPSKRTSIALAIALELNLTETTALLEKAGYALSHSQKFDVIVEYFIKKGKFNIFEINEVLFKYDQSLLGV